MKKYTQLLSLIGLFFMVSCSSNDTNTAKKTSADTKETTTSTKKNIVFFGNSLTAGYGLDNPSGDGWVALVGQRIDSLDLPYRCINAGNSGETTAGGNERVAFLLENQSVDIFVLELGGNDALRGIDPASSEKNLQGIVEKVKAKYPNAKIILAGMQAPLSMGKDYTQKFGAIYPRLAKANNVALIPFILETVGGNSSLNQKDGIHPNETGNKIIAETVWKALKPLL